MKTVNQFVLLTILGFGLTSCSKKTGQVVVSPYEPPQVGTETPRTHEKHITILATNDIHGGVEPTVSKAGKKAGGMAIFSGVVNAIRTGLKNKYGADGGVLLVDGGDQFQGTLLSNYSEGKLVFDIMNHIGYDAAVLGNHDFDFGPEGWLQDKVVAGESDQDPRGALKKLVASKKSDFHLISANIYYTNSIVKDGKSGEQIPVKVKPVGCEALTKDDAKAIRWDQARRFELAQPYAIKDVAGVRVAMIGIENVETPQTTTPENVSDLCFRDAADSYLEVREQLEDQADVFIMVTHNGDTENSNGATDIVKKVLERAKNKETVLHAVVAGHTHYVNHTEIEGIPLIQSKADGKYFGRIDLVWDVNSRKLIGPETHYYGGIYLSYGECPTVWSLACVEDNFEEKIYWEGIEVKADPQVVNLIAEQRTNIAPLANKKLGKSKGEMKKDYYKENSMSDRVTDEFLKMMKRRMPGLHGKNLVTIINGGGVRAPLPAGDFTYEDWFRVFPFNNRIALKGPVKVEQLAKVIERGVNTCGSHGGLTPGGIRVQFNRECADKPEPKEFKLLKIKLPDSNGGVKVIYDSENGIIDDEEIWIATLDFLAAGGSGYTAFKDMPDVPLSSTRTGGVDLIFREALSEYFEAYPPEFDPDIDHRLQNLLEVLKKPQKVTQLFR